MNFSRIEIATVSNVMSNFSVRQEMTNGKVKYNLYKGDMPLLIGIEEVGLYVFLKDNGKHNIFVLIKSEGKFKTLRINSEGRVSTLFSVELLPNSNTSPTILNKIQVECEVDDNVFLTFNSEDLSVEKYSPIAARTLPKSDLKYDDLVETSDYSTCIVVSNRRYA